MSIVAIRHRPSGSEHEREIIASRDDAGLRGIVSATKEQVPLLTLLGLYLLARFAWMGGQWPLDWTLVLLFARAFALMTGLAVALLVLSHPFRVTHHAPGTFAAFRLDTWICFLREYFSTRRITGVLIAWGFLSVFTALFIHWKADIGTSIPFTWDERFMRWDRVVHFGRHPWEWLQPLLGYPGVTAAIDTLYHPVWLFLAWSSHRVLVSRFLVSYALLWIILGTVLAYVFASAGPVFYAGVVTSAPNPYGELMAYLMTVDNHYDLTAPGGALVLWNNFVSQDWPRVGISAMPSMHVATAALMTMLGFHIHKIWGVLASVYLVVVLLGSVHLAWHYAIDGYLSCLLVGPVWWLSGQWLRCWLPFCGIDPTGPSSARAKAG
jgi:hypothetical protein